MRRKGFTLIELLIVMAVIAILIAIAVPAFRGMRQEAMNTRIEGDLKVVKIALESYYKSQGSYPDVTNYQTTLLGTTPRILESEAKDPYTTSVYGYAKSTNGRYYVAYSTKGVSGVTITISDTGTVTTSPTAELISVTGGY